MTAIAQFTDHPIMTETASGMTAKFDERYRMGAEPAVRRVEQRVIGADYGATSYTTRAQADWLGTALGLGPGKGGRTERPPLLLDIGSGAGWPGIYLARSTGCRVVLADKPLKGLRAAARRIRQEGVEGFVLAASGERLPLQEGAFDAVTSSDVLC